VSWFSQRWVKGTTAVAAFAVLGLAGFLVLSPWLESSAAPLNPKPPDLVVHEWGTFLSVQGSDGTAMGGMVDSEEDLPPFVRERSLDGRNPIYFNQKMETPVTYFYVDKPMSVQVRVAMPDGLLTHWYPGAKNFGPPNNVKATKDDSFLDWATVELIPDRAGVLATLKNYKGVSKDSTWRFARETDAAYVRVKDRPAILPVGEVEKFLFYRGLGSFQLPLQVVSPPPVRSDLHPRLILTNTATEPLRGVFAVRVRDGQIAFTPLADLAGKETRTVRDLAGYRESSRQENGILGVELPLSEGVPLVKKAVADSLVKAGLYRKEAEAMVNTWEKSYFRTDGLRFLYVLPAPTVDRAIPITISPRPDELVRVMVGRVEVLTRDVEHRLMQTLYDTISSDATIRKQGEAVLAKLGRLQEPVLRRLLALLTDDDVKIKAKIEELLKTKPRS
jgi:hypothetical protein